MVGIISKPDTQQKQNIHCADVEHLMGEVKVKRVLIRSCIYNKTGYDEDNDGANQWKEMSRKLMPARG